MGRYRFKRLPFGLNLAKDIFQHHMGIMLDNLNYIINIADDIRVYGRDRPTHDGNLLAIMYCAREYGLVFNKDKCVIFAE